DNPIPLTELLNSLLLDRVRAAFPRPRFPSALDEALGHCARLGELMLQDAAVFLAVSVAQAERYGLSSLGSAQGGAAWLSALATRRDIVEEVWKTNRGAVLFGLEAAAVAVDAWAVARAGPGVAALV